VIFLANRALLKFFSLAPLLQHTSHEALPLTRTWWPPGDRERDWKHVSLIINFEGKVVFKWEC